jgi:uncharacterized protein
MTNRLATETSPYLRQHMHNPVDWYPWGADALQRAKTEDKPILLSIGYTACHWCHVMERESFEDDATAADMNQWFVCIKVDREERPDLDSVYMSAVQAMTGQGGWPMTVFLTPDGRPFYGGTYFPPEPRHGMPAFRQLLAAVHDAWVNKREGLEQQSTELTEAIKRVASFGGGGDAPTLDLLRDAAATLVGHVDTEWGGFGQGMKFPQAAALEFLLRMHLRGVEGCLEALTLTLDRMARGGIFDQVGGGFHRYAVDRIWLVPHFEKMLYDNAQLLRLYVRAYQVTGSALYRDTALATAAYLLREMQHPDGGFYSSQDADSEGAEGKFYVWPFEEIIAIAGDDMPLAVAAFALSGHGNWEGNNVLWRPHPDEEVAKDAEVDVETLRAAIERVRAALFTARGARVRPQTDDKILASWNGLTIAALAEAGRVLHRKEFIQSAERAATFVLASLRDERGRLQRSWREGQTSGPAFLDDHAMLADGLLTLYETTFDVRWWQEALALGETILSLFSDNDGATFYDTGSDAQQILIRPKDLFDNAVPSGNSAASDVLLRLAALSGNADIERAGSAPLIALAGAMAHSPSAFGAAMGALDRYLGPGQEVAIVGATDGPLVETVRAAYAPNRVVAAGAAGSAEPPLLADRPTRGDTPTAYVCQHFSCRMPVTTPEELAAQLS